jgi:hypothetical protein
VDLQAASALAYPDIRPAFTKPLQTVFGPLRTLIHFALPPEGRAGSQALARYVCKRSYSCPPRLQPLTYLQRQQSQSRHAGNTEVVQSRQRPWPTWMERSTRDAVVKAKRMYTQAEGLPISDSCRSRSTMAAHKTCRLSPHVRPFHPSLDVVCRVRTPRVPVYQGPAALCVRSTLSRRPSVAVPVLAAPSAEFRPDNTGKSGSTESGCCGCQGICRRLHSPAAQVRCLQ